MPSAWRSPAIERHRRGDFDAGAGAGRCRKHREQQIGLTVAGEAGKTDDLALMRDQFGDAHLSRRAGANPKRRSPASKLVTAARLALSSFAAHGRDQLVAIEGFGGVGGDALAVAHHHDAITVFQDFAQKMRDEDAAYALRRRCVA